MAENKQRKSYKPPFKAIETRYDGYRFRSRLEARHALFFNTLGIPYIYEMEVFDLEGTWYLPDFYLPKHNCFIEIKGVEPTPEELRKAKLLSLYTLKNVYIFSGEVGIDKHGLSAYGFQPPVVGYWKPKPGTKDKEFSPEIHWTMQRLYDAGIGVTLNERGDDIILRQDDTWVIDDFEDCSWEDLYSFIAERGRSTVSAMDLLRRYRPLFIEGLQTKGEEWIWVEMSEMFRCSWGECLECSGIVITHGNAARQIPCLCQREANTQSDIILDAYRTAREYRF